MLRKLILVIIFSFISSICFGAINFDGADDLVNCGSNVSLDKLHQGQMTIAYWATVNSFVANARYLNKGTDGGVSGNGWYNNMAIAVGGNPDFCFSVRWTGSGVGEALWYVSDPPIIGTTYHVVITYDGSSTVNKPSVYLNGISQSIGELRSAAGSQTDDSSMSLIIGNRETTPNRCIDGRISEVAIWNIILTQPQIDLLAFSKIKGMPLQIAPGNLKGYWPMDDRQSGISANGDTIRDLSGNGNNGTGDDGANNTGCTWQAETILTYSPRIQ